MATKYRVFRVSPTLLKAVRAKRDANPGITTKMILDAACSESLPRVVKTLQSIGCKMSKSKVVVKWPVDPELLGCLHVASRQTSISVQQLLTSALTVFVGKGAKQ